MKNLFQNRILSICLIVGLLFGVLAVRAGRLQLYSGSALTGDAESLISKEMSLVGARGTIYDANMQPLAYDQSCFDVTFYRDPSKRNAQDLYDYSDAILRAITIVERNGGEVNLPFNLYVDEQGVSYFDFNTTNAETFAKREALWRDNFFVTKIALENLYATLTNRYGIQDLPAGRQRQVLAVWQEMQMNAFLSVPITIASNVNDACVAQIEVQAANLPGIEVALSSVRVYPRDNMAAHVIGYVGRISDEQQLEQYVSQGYAADALVGLTGIERNMEGQLTANVDFRKGKQRVEVNLRGKIVRILEEVPPMDGNSVVLTLDSGFQRVLDEALKGNIIEDNRVEWADKLRNMDWITENARELTEIGGTGRVSVQQLDTDTYQVRDAATNAHLCTFRYEQTTTGADVIDVLTGEVLRKVKLAHSGAAVIMNVHDGSVLAMSSMPDYDLNLFTSAPDSKKQQALFTDETYPMLNRGISSKFTPGSIYKMNTALAGLMEGVITPEERIDCQIHYEAHVVSGKAPRCWTNYRPNHAGLNMKGGIEQSCNYYFFTIADRLNERNPAANAGATTLSKWASALGLTSRTGIELPGETAGTVGNQITLYDPNRTLGQQDTSKPRLCYNQLQNLLVIAGTARGLEYEQERLDRVCLRLMQLAVDVPLSEWGPPIREILMDEMAMPGNFISSQGLVNSIIAALREIRWDVNETLYASIGQSIDQLTVVGVARYVAALANGGTVYEARLVDKIIAPDGSVVMQKSPVVVNQIEGAQYALSIIRSGMKGVISPEDGGTASNYFVGYPYIDMIGGKTGTAENNELDVENNAWFVAFAPFDNPEIAIAVCIPNGYSGGLASLAVKDVVTYFMERDAMGGEMLSQPGEIIR